MLSKRKDLFFIFAKIRAGAFGRGIANWITPVAGDKASGKLGW
jgi:hypothetical protein